MTPGIRLARRVAIAVGALTLFALAPGRAEQAIDRLSVPGPIAFDGENYLLSWSSHPSPQYYKQEYLPAGEANDHFQRMVLVEAIVQGAAVNDVVSQKLAMLERRKSSDPTINYAILKNPKTGEVILDFVLSAPDKVGEIVEWNAYRYVSLPGNGVLLFGISRRAYGDATTEFLRGLKSARPREIETLARYKLPAVVVKD